MRASARSDKTRCSQGFGFGSRLIEDPNTVCELLKVRVDPPSWPCEQVIDYIADGTVRTDGFRCDALGMQERSHGPIVRASLGIGASEFDKKLRAPAKQLAGKSRGLDRLASADRLAWVAKLDGGGYAVNLDVRAAERQPKIVPVLAELLGKVLGPGEEPSNRDRFRLLGRHDRSRQVEAAGR